MRPVALIALVLLLAATVPAEPLPALPSEHVTAAEASEGAGVEDHVTAPLGSDLEAVQATLRLPAATWYNDRDGDKLFDTLEARFAADPLGRQPVVVTFVDGTDAAGAAAAEAAAGPSAVRHVLPHLGMMTADVGPLPAARIAALDAVRQVEWLQPGAPELDSATAMLGADAVQNLLGYSGDLDGVPTQITGEDVVIAIMDTGFDGEHPDLQGKFLHFIDWQDGTEKAAYDSGSHGTHVASIAGGLGAVDARYRGVAPGAVLVGFKISGEGQDSKEDTLRSIEWILDHLDDVPVRISTISFGFGTTVDGTDALELAFDHLFEAGVLPFKSTGNSGPEKHTVTIPGGARGIVSVASIYDPGEGGFHLSSFSSRGPTVDGRLKPDIAAPGSNIMAAVPPADGDSTHDDYASFSGTSMASPFAAGTAALVLSADPSLSNVQVRDVLLRTAHDWGTPGHDIDYGHGRIDVLAAVQVALVDRAVREAWPYDRVAALDVAGPPAPFHAGGQVDGASAAEGMVEATVEVQDPEQPLAITLIMNGSAEVLDEPVVLPNGLVADPIVRAVYAEIQDPTGAVVASLGLSGTAPQNQATLRQQTYPFPTTTAGVYTIRFVNVRGGEEVIWDVSGGLAQYDARATPIPDEAAYQAALDEAGPARATPGVGLVSIAGLAVALAVRRRLDRT